LKGRGPRAGGGARAGSDRLAALARGERPALERLVLIDIDLGARPTLEDARRGSGRPRSWICASEL
jgi:hypothetical protein